MIRIDTVFCLTFVDSMHMNYEGYCGNYSWYYKAKYLRVYTFIGIEYIF